MIKEWLQLRFDLELDSSSSRFRFDGRSTAYQRSLKVYSDVTRDADLASRSDADLFIMPRP